MEVILYYSVAIHFNSKFYSYDILNNKKYYIRHIHKRKLTHNVLGRVISV